jgi:uncharacterized membrane protein
MNNSSDEELQVLKQVAATVYLCQALSFIFAALPLLVGVGLNLYKRNDVQGTWLESHFNWQIKTCWVTLAGLAFTAFTFGMGIGIFTLFITIFWLVYRITIGWISLADGETINRM